MAYLYKSKKNGEKKNIIKIKKLYESAIKLGNSDAMIELAIIYKYGIGQVKKDITKTIELYENAIELGNLDAMLQLGHIYYQEECKDKKFTKCIKLYERAIDLGNKDAMKWMARMYRCGDGVKYCIKKSFELYLRSGDYDESKKMIDNLDNYNSCDTRINYETKLDLLKISLKYDFYKELNRYAAILLQNDWAHNVFSNQFPHQKHPQYNYTINLFIMKLI